MNWTSFKNLSYKATFSLSQRWPLNTGLIVYKTYSLFLLCIYYIFYCVFTTYSTVYLLHILLYIYCIFYCVFTAYSTVSPMIPPLFGKQEVGIWRVKKRFPWYGVPIWSLWPNIRFLPSIVAEKNAGILFYLCPSFRPSKIFFITFFSVTVDGRNLIFGHKRHIGIPYCG
jgi:hypothetical protein